MDNKRLIEIITNEICSMLRDSTLLTVEEIVDIASKKYKDEIKLKDSENEEALDLMRRNTTARVGIGKVGPRVNTKTMLALRADHATAKDAVLRNVDQNILDDMGLFTFKTRCTDIEQHLTRPDYGREFDKNTIDDIKNKCKFKPRVQIFVSDGLSSSAVDVNIANILPVMIEGLKDLKIDVGTPFFVKFGRVAAMDTISEILEPEVICVLLGERPGLAAADSMSAYIAYKAKVGMPEARRTVISNIHSGGIPAIEAGAYAVDVIVRMLEEKQSGVDLRL